MDKETLIVVMEYPNINRPASDRGLVVDYEDLLIYLTADRFLIEAYCFVPIDPNARTARDRDIEELRLQGYLVSTKVGRPDPETNSYKCNFDVEITMELMRIATEVKPNVIVLASGDIDFIPVVEFLRRKGIRVEVASFESSASRDLIVHCSGFIELDKWVDQHHAEGER